MIPIKPLYPGNRFQVFVVLPQAIVLCLWKLFWLLLFPSMLGKVNREADTADTGISTISAVQTVLLNSIRGIKLRDVLGISDF